MTPHAHRPSEESWWSVLWNAAWWIACVLIGLVILVGMTARG